MSKIFVVFALPLIRPGDRDFLAAYSSRQAAQRFVNEQDCELRGQLQIEEIEVDRHPVDDGYWKIPP